MEVKEELVLWMQISLVNAKKLRMVNGKHYQKIIEKVSSSLSGGRFFNIHTDLQTPNNCNWPEDTYKSINLLERKYFKYLHSFKYYTEIPYAYVNVHMQEEIVVLSLGRTLQQQA